MPSAGSIEDACLDKDHDGGSEPCANAILELAVISATSAINVKNLSFIVPPEENVVLDLDVEWLYCLIRKFLFFLILARGLLCARGCGD